MKALRSLVLLMCYAWFAIPGRAGTLVQFQMYFGFDHPPSEVDVELYDQDKPVTVGNFLGLIKAGAYPHVLFHRLEPGFVLQGGSYLAINRGSSEIIAPPFDDLLPVFNFGAITNEFGVGKFYSNTNWTVAMAKTSDPNSATSGFFFNLANNAASLDNTNNSGGFTVFGHVVRGTNVLNFFNSLSFGNGIVNLTNLYGPTGAFPELPTEFAGTNAPPYYGLVYADINLVNLQASTTTNGARQLVWNGIPGVTNNLEYATNLPPVWQVLAGTNPPAAANITIIDAATNDTLRFYRVHVLF